MDSNIASEQDFSDNLALVEPHFDEEATLLSARPVVPLEEVNDRQRLGRRLGFGVAIIASLILGALGAKFIYRSGEAAVGLSDAARGGAASMDEPAQPPSIIEGAAGATTKGLPRATTVEVKLEPRTPVNHEAFKKVVNRQKSTPQSSDDTAQSGDEREFQEEERSTDRRFERERDRDRDERRETRWRRRRSADGLSRIKDIFEGSRRP